MAKAGAISRPSIAEVDRGDLPVDQPYAAASSTGSRAMPFDEPTQMPAAPSVSGEELPAVSVPLPLVRSNVGGSLASFSSEVSLRGMVSRTVARHLDHQVVEEAALPAGDGVAMALAARSRPAPGGRSAIPWR